MICSTIFLFLACISVLYWKRKFIPKEVRENAADFAANGSDDDLQRGYHSRQNWSRVWPGLACCVVPAVPLAFVSWGAASLGFGAMAAGLLGIFIRDFTTKLNLARIANGDTWLSEWYASPASKSFPDAGSWKKVRAHLAATGGDKYAPSQAAQQILANQFLKATVLSAWRLCLLVAGLLAGGAVWVGVK